MCTLFIKHFYNITTSIAEPIDINMKERRQCSQELKNVIPLDDRVFQSHFKYTMYMYHLAATFLDDPYRHG